MAGKVFAILPFNSSRVKDKYLLSNQLGAWDFLDKKEFREFSSYSLKKGSALYERLYGKGLVADSNNIERLFNEYRSLNANLFLDTSLHIAVVTTRCNLRCRYCQSNTLKPQDMDSEVATRVLKYLFDVRNMNITLEFQGGEPLLNWKTLSFLIEHARKFNVTGKDLRIALVSNLTLLDEAKIKFLLKHDVEICGSLDGPKAVHDKNRVLSNGKGTYDLVVKNVRKIQKEFKRKINLLPTITSFSLPYYKEIIDEYVSLGQDEICLRPVNKLGIACVNWPNLGYTAEEFNDFYDKAMDYIFALNKKGVLIKERMARVISEKIFNKKDPGYVELMNPCGSGRSTIVYMPDGSCFPCDEARMLGEEMFKLGNILKENYEELMKKDNLLHLIQSSLTNLWDYNNVYSPWLGTCPVVNYALQKNIVPKVSCSPLHKINNFQFRYIFEKILENKGNENILRGWITGGKK